LYREAVNDYDRAILLAPNEAGFYANRAWAQLQLNNNPEAVANFAEFSLRANYTVPSTLLTLINGWMTGGGVGTDSGPTIDVGEARG
jgi:tetratricopeptide (TPR) repeat protein